MSHQLFKPCKSQVSQKVISNFLMQFLMCCYHLCVIVHSYQALTNLLSTKLVLCNHKYT